MATKKYWIKTAPRATKPKVPEATKKLVQQQFDQMIETELKPRCIQPPPKQDFNYLVDILAHV